MEKTDELVKALQRLAAQTQKMNSYYSSFARGIFFGVGSAIGASIIAALVVGSLLKSFDFLKNIFV